MNEIEKGEAVAALAEVSLVTRETLDDGSPAISLHRLVQEVMRRRLGEGAAEAAALATRLVADAYPNPSDRRAQLARLPPPRSPRRRRAGFRPRYRRIGRKDQPSAQSIRAAPQGARGLRPSRAALPPRARHQRATASVPDDPGIATTLNNLAQLLQATNRLADAEPLMRRALTIDEESFGPGHPRVATA